MTSKELSQLTIILLNDFYPSMYPSVAKILNGNKHLIVYFWLIFQAAVFPKVFHHRQLNLRLLGAELSVIKENHTLAIDVGRAIQQEWLKTNLYR